MKTNKKTLKTIVFSIGLAAMTLSANNLNAQNDGSRGLFGKGSNWFDEMLDREDETFGIENQSFGEEAPLGSGLGILLVAGLGYVALKNHEKTQHNFDGRGPGFGHGAVQERPTPNR